MDCPSIAVGPGRLPRLALLCPRGGPGARSGLRRIRGGCGPRPQPLHLDWRPPVEGGPARGALGPRHRGEPAGDHEGVRPRQAWPWKPAHPDGSVVPASEAGPAGRRPCRAGHGIRCGGLCGPAGAGPGQGHRVRQRAVARRDRGGGGRGTGPSLRRETRSVLLRGHISAPGHGSGHDGPPPGGRGRAGSAPRHRRPKQTGGRLPRRNPRGVARAGPHPPRGLSADVTARGYLPWRCRAFPWSATCTTTRPTPTSSSSSCTATCRSW